MSIQAESSTSLTLLGRLRQSPNDPAAWREFVLRYGPRILAWCGRWKLQPADAEDVAQEVLQKMHRAFRTFVYDPSKSFRAYLRRVTRNAWQRWSESQPRECATGDNTVLEHLQNAEAGDDLVCHLEDAYEKDIFEEAAKRVQLRVAPHNWKAFCLRVFDEMSGEAVADRLGMQRATVFAIQQRIKKMLKDEIQKLQADGDES